MADDIRLYWWSEKFIQKKDHENYGDLLGKYIVEKISGKRVTWLRANKFYVKNLWRPVYVTIGSVLEHVGSHCVVWGSGISHRDAKVSKATFSAVRGPLSRKRLLELGYECPEVYGDPALLLPDCYNPKTEKIYEIGVVPHINDIYIAQKLFKNDGSINIVDFKTNDIEATTRELLKCKRVISSSLHGIIVAHAYGIPAVQVEFSKNIYGDGVKYHDYYESVELGIYEPDFIREHQDIDQWIRYVDEHVHKLPKSEIICNLKKQLMANCPFELTSI